MILSFSLCYIMVADLSCAGTVLASVFIPLIGASAWTNTANANNTFFFFDIKENTNTSTFSGNENLIGGGQATFTGSFLNHDIIFVYNAGSAKKGTYKGTVNDASTIITLTSSDNLPALALKK